MGLVGFAHSCMVVSTFSRAQRQVLDMGFADDINTYVMISGTYNRPFKKDANFLLLLHFCAKISS